VAAGFAMLGSVTVASGCAGRSLRTARRLPVRVRESVLHWDVETGSALATARAAAICGRHRRDPEQWWLMHVPLQHCESVEHSFPVRIQAMVVVVVVVVVVEVTAR